jgi:carbon monoxide dehydrogenase subunit G
MATQIETKDPLKSLALSSVGKSVKGAIGNLRSKDRVDFEATPEGGTRVTLTSEMAIGGMLGALGQKAIASKSKEITEKFAQALQAEIRAGRRGDDPDPA